MLIGCGAAVAGAWATPDYLGAFAEQAERAGYASLWTFQRLLVPEGSGMEPVYHSVLDPMVALGYAAAKTSRIRLGVAVINLPFLSPAVVAKQAASVDVLSGGRLDLGLGIGWMPEEFALTGASTPRRGARTEEYVAVLRRLWSGDGAPYEGEFYTVPAGKQEPRPVQRPGPPVLLGGMSRPAMERAGRVADGWITSSRADLAKISEAVAVIQDAAAAAGRDPVRIICRGVVRAGADESRLLSGGYQKIREDTAWLESQGVTEVFYDLNWDPAVGNPSVSPESAAARAQEILAALAPLCSTCAIFRRMDAIHVAELRMRYGDSDVLNGVSFAARRGEVLALLGPNGAGKTTTIEILEGFRIRSAGEVSVLGSDPAHASEAWRARIGIVLQSWRDHSRWQVRELLAHLGSYYRPYSTAAVTRPWDTDELIAAVGLTEHARKRVQYLSGGQRRRLDVAIGIVGRPELLFLDEPTAGFDPEARRDFHDLVHRLADREHATILLTTHDLDEAEKLADRILILSGGRIIADGSAEELSRLMSTQSEVRWSRDGQRFVHSADDATRFVRELFRQYGESIEDLEVRRASLEDTYMALVHDAEAAPGRHLQAVSV